MTMQAEDGMAPLRAPSRRLVLRGALGAGALAAAGLAGAALWGGVRPGPAAPSHAYRALGDAPSAEAAALAARLGPGFEARVLELAAPGEDRPLARIEAAVAAEGPARLLGWQSLGPAPILRRDIRPAEELRLVGALEQHLPEGSTILAMPELSRRLAALAAAGLPLAAEAEPLALPPVWQGQGAAVAALEEGQWGGPVAAGVEGEGISAFVAALLAEDVSGAARLRVLAGAGEAYVLVHLEDAFHLGQIAEGRLAMARRSFAAGSFSHDLAREARAWGQTNGHAAWAVDRGPDGRLRGHYLTEPAETATLIAQLLPFNTSRLDAVPGLRLVWQAEGYWLYRISAFGTG